MMKWLLGIGVVVLLATFVWSLWWEASWLSRPFANVQVELAIAGGALEAGIATSATGNRGYGHLVRPRSSQVRWWFAHHRIVGPAPETRDIVYIPLWALFVAMSAGMSACWYRDCRRKRRTDNPDVCGKCSYNLAGLPRDGKTPSVCPECGCPFPSTRRGAKLAEKA